MGETEAERTAAYPCDELMHAPHQTCFRAIDVDAPAPIVWRWFCQMQVAPYSYDWIDNLGRRSPRELTPGLDQLEVGQQVMTIFRLAEFERDRTFTLHAPKSIFGQLALTYRVTPTGDDSSRITVKLMVRYSRRTAWFARHVPPIGDWIMMREQLRTFKALAERDHRRATALGD
jgi:hypothetical protein